MDVNKMCAELFGKHGLDDGGPVAEIIQKKFESYLKSRLPHWEFNRINTSHNPRIVQARPVRGEWIYVDGCSDLAKLPAELRKAIEEFLPTFERMFFVLCCLLYDS